MPLSVPFIRMFGHIWKGGHRFGHTFDICDVFRAHFLPCKHTLSVLLSLTVRDVGFVEGIWMGIWEGIGGDIVNGVD